MTELDRNGQQAGHQGTPVLFQCRVQQLVQLEQAGLRAAIVETLVAMRTQDAAGWPW